MEKVKYHEFIAWEWECPECDLYNIIESSGAVPMDIDTVICNECKTEFKLVPG